MRLRAATSDVHAGLEAASPLAGPALTPHGYRRYLERLWGYYAALEPALLASPALAGAPMLGLAERRKLAWLDADLRALGTSSAQLPLCASIPRSDSVAAVAGCAYVLEGATLGGQVLYRTLSVRLNLGIDRGARFLYGYGEQAGAMWRRFVTALNALEFDSREVDACIAAARSTFETLGNWLADTPEDRACVRAAARTVSGRPGGPS